MWDEPPREREEAIEVTAGRRLNRAAGILAFSVLTDSAMEHYRGASRTGRCTRRWSRLAGPGGQPARSGDSRRRHGFAPCCLCSEGADGPRRPGVPPLQRRQTPRRLLLAEPVLRRADRRTGGVARCAGVARLRRRARARQPARRPPRLFGLPAGRALAAVTARRPAGHRGRGGAAAFPRRLPQPVDVAAGHRAAGRGGPAGRVRRLGRPRRHRRLTRWLAAADRGCSGFGGVGFHAYGVQRNMGGWRNWSQNC